MNEISSNVKANLVSVLLPVYNGAEYLVEAINSILAQTFQDFELIVINDGSTDASSEIVRSFHDKRIAFYQQQNQGLAATLNRGIEISRGKYIARQDQDDISMPERLAEQVKFLELHPDCGMVGTWAEIWVGEEKTKRTHQHPCDNLALQYELLFNNPFVHSSVMLRRSALDRVGGYSTDRNRQPPEDYELWSRIARCYEVRNISKTLLVYREVPHSMSRSGVSPFLNHLITISAENIAWAANLPSDDPAPINIAALVHNVKDRLIGEPDFRSMANVLRKAVARLSNNNASLQREAYYKLEHLKYSYWNGSHTGTGRRIFYRILRAKSKFLRMLSSWRQ
jgi:glycosyltransferase involved in cell wall biosynthesis